MDKGPFHSKVRFDAAHPSALAVYCSDGRFTDAVEELLHTLGHPRLDTVTLPGGPGLLELASGGLSAVEATRRGVSLLVAAHGTRHAVLLAHEGCGYYRQRYGMETPAEIAAHQVNDLRLAARWLTSAHDGVSVLLYYARIVSGAVLFEPISAAGEASLFGARPRSVASVPPPPPPPAASSVPKAPKPPRRK